MQTVSKRELEWLNQYQIKLTFGQKFLLKYYYGKLLIYNNNKGKFIKKTEQL